MKRLSDSLNRCVENGVPLLAYLDSKFSRTDVIMCVGENNKRFPAGASVYFHKSNKQWQPEVCLTNILILSSSVLKQSLKVLSWAHGLKDHVVSSSLQLMHTNIRYSFWITVSVWWYSCVKPQKFSFSILNLCYSKKKKIVFFSIMLVILY